MELYGLKIWAQRYQKAVKNGERHHQIGPKSAAIEMSAFLPIFAG
jgi:hypothetical protein